MPTSSKQRVALFFEIFCKELYAQCAKEKRSYSHSQAKKRAEGDKYDLFKRLQHGLSPNDPNSKPPNIYVDNRVFIYDGEKGKTERPYVRGAGGSGAGGKGVSAKTYIIDREMKLSNDPKVGRVIITTKEPVKKTLTESAKGEEPGDHEIKKEGDGKIAENRELLGNDIDSLTSDGGKTASKDEGNGFTVGANKEETKPGDSAETLSDTPSPEGHEIKPLATNGGADAEKSNGIPDDERKETPNEKRKPKLITLPGPHNFIVPETKKFSNAMRNLSTLESLTQKDTPNLALLSTKGIFSSHPLGIIFILS